MCRWMIDAACGKRYGTNEKVISHMDRARGTGQWDTEAMLGGPRFLNDSKHASIEGKTFEPKIENGSAWYWWVEKTSITEQDNTDKAVVGVTAELELADYIRVASAFGSSASGGQSSGGQKAETAPASKPPLKKQR